MALPGSQARAWRSLSVLLVCAVAGGLFAAASVTSEGTDLRPAGGDLASLLKERAARVEQNRAEARSLQSDIDALSKQETGGSLDKLLDRVAALQGSTGLTAMKGPGVKVTLTDAPRSVDVPGLDPNVLVVHQQDIQAFVNALWSGGAEALTLQGQRLISTTGIKCVGNTVVLDGVPYSPPYVIEAIGDVGSMNAALQTSPEVITYREYVDRYQLGLKVQNVDEMKAPAYAGTVSLSYATALDRDDS